MRLLPFRCVLVAVIACGAPACSNPGAEEAKPFAPASTQTVKPVVDEELSDLNLLLNSNVYQKAGFTLHMLRREVGDSSFFRAVRAYYAKYRHGRFRTDRLGPRRPDRYLS